jgi:predicted TPR repeat methyltransferase
MNRAREATECYCKVITLRPKHREARRLLALAHCVLGDVGAAVNIFDEWLAEEPGDPVALHMRAACGGRAVPARASREYVAATFDSFAASFEAKLQQLSYRAPALVAAMLQESGLEPPKRFDVLDAGCGTGLCGPLLAPYARRLVGVDLSGGMLALAREKQVYDALVTSELTDYLRDQPATFDVIASADTLVYFGELESVVGAAASALRPDGLFVFTLEHAVGCGTEIDWRLELHGRYSHAPSYVERVLAACGLEAWIVPAELRMESGAPVAGLVVRGRKGVV